MANDEAATAAPEVAVWAVASEPTQMPADALLPAPAGPLNGDELARLRSVLEAYSATPLVFIEAHPVQRGAALSSGRVLSATSHLARSLSELAKTSGKAAPTGGTQAGEVLYRMIVPAKLARDVGLGAVRPMAAAAVPGAVRGQLVNTAGTVVGGSAFMPVVGRTGAAAAGATGATAATALTVGGAITLAAPIALVVVAAAAAAHAEQQQLRALGRIADLLESAKDDDLRSRQDRLAAAARACDKAMALLLDEGKVGHSLGLDSAVHAVDQEVERAARLLARWRPALEQHAGGTDVAALKKAFPGIADEAGEFITDLHLARVAIALKRRFAVVQAVEHAQSSPGTTLPRFAALLKSEQGGIDELELAFADFLTALANLSVRPPSGPRKALMTRAEVVELLAWPDRLRRIADLGAREQSTRPVTVEVLAQRDGSVRLLTPSEG